MMIALLVKVFESQVINEESDIKESLNVERMAEIF